MKSFFAVLGLVLALGGGLSAFFYSLLTGNDPLGLRVLDGLSLAAFAAGPGIFILAAVSVADDV
jgi:hypothetical protein